MIIRQAKIEDGHAIAKVHVNSWRSTYCGILPDTVLANLSLEKRQNIWQKMLENAAKDNHFIYVAVLESGEIIGFADGGKERNENTIYKGEIYAIYILETHQRQGIGTKLFKIIVQRLTEIEINSFLVWVLANNPSCEFYRSLGGEQIAEKEIERGGMKFKEIGFGWQDRERIFLEN